MDIRKKLDELLEQIKDQGGEEIKDLATTIDSTGGSPPPDPVLAGSFDSPETQGSKTTTTSKEPGSTIPSTEVGEQKSETPQAQVESGLTANPADQGKEGKKAPTKEPSSNIGLVTALQSSDPKTIELVSNIIEKPKNAIK